MEQRKAYLARVYDYIRVRFRFVSPEVAEWIACLSGLESSFGTSAIAIDCNNYIGMKYPRVRLSTAIDERRGHAYYSSFESCVCDFFYWCMYAGMNQSHFLSLEGFLRKFRAAKYNPNPEYCNRVNLIKDQYYG